jgi:aminoglycoside phosphotransferase family enzyme
LSKAPLPLPRKTNQNSEREVTPNRRLCPDIYLGVIPISLSAGKLTFGKGEKVVECAVKMRELQDRYFLLRLLRRDQVTMKDLDRIVSRLKDFYEAETPTQKITKWARPTKAVDWFIELAYAQ